MALRHHVPFIAVDQIQGGAKVMNLVGATHWPFVFEASKTNASYLASQAAQILRQDYRDPLFDAYECSVRQANTTLARLIEIVSELQ